MPTLHGHILFVLLLALASPSFGTEHSLRLYNFLLEQDGYDPNSRPVLNHNEPLLLYMNLSLIQILDVDEKNQIISLRVWVNQEWTDPNFIWDPAEFGNIEEMYIPSTQIWTPDLVLYNNAGGHWDLKSVTNTTATVRYDGSVIWRPQTIFKSQCEIDVEYFPFDRQNCSLKIGTWTHAGYVIDLRHTAQKSDPVPGFDNCGRHIDYAIDLSFYQNDVEWDVIDVSAQRNIQFYLCCDAPFLDLRYHLTIRRRILFYGVNLICPCLAISFLTVLVFYLPADSNEKISLSINVLVSLTVFYLLIFDISPPTSLVVPLILKYLLFTMILITLSVIMTVIVLNIHWRSPENNTITHWVRTVFMNTLPRLLFMSKPECGFHANSLSDQQLSLKDEELSRMFDSSEQIPKWRQRRQAVTDETSVTEIQLALEGCRRIVGHVQKQDKYHSMRDDWKYVALVLDRLFLWIFSVATVIGTLGIFMQSPTLTDQGVGLTADNAPTVESINVTRLLCETKS